MKRDPLSFPTVKFLMLAALFGYGLSLASAPPANGKKAKSVYSVLARVPESARSKRNPLEDDAATRAAGRKLFGQYCAQCHGKAAEGSPRAPSLLAPRVQEAAPGALYWILSNGVVRRGMPDWSKLPEPMRWQIVTFIESLRAAKSGRKSMRPH